MSYQVTAGMVTVETAINDRGARAYVDILRGSELPSDVPQEQVDRLLALEHIAKQSEEPEEVEQPEGQAEDELSKDELLELAESEGIEVDGRWSAKRISKAIDESRS